MLMTFIVNIDHFSRQLKNLDDFLVDNYKILMTFVVNIDHFSRQLLNFDDFCNEYWSF